MKQSKQNLNYELFLMLVMILTIPVWAEPIQIGWTGPLTGNSAVLGVDSVEAAQIAINEKNKTGGVNGRLLELIVEDDQYNTAKAVTAYTKLVANKNMVGILMSTYGGVFATAKKAIIDKVMVINPLDCNNDIAALPDNTFCIATESESIGRVIGEDIVKRKIAPVGVIYDESNPFMTLVEKSLRQSLEERGSKVVTTNGVGKNTADFNSILLRIRSKNVKSLVLLGHDPMGKAMTQARSLGIKAQFYTLGTITSPGYQDLAGETASGSLVAYWEAPDSNKNEAFNEKFQARVGRLPILELATIPTYDATKMLIKAIEQSISADGSISPEKLRSNLLSFKDYDGLSGRISMDTDGAVRSIQEKMYRFTNGKLKKVIQ